MAIAEFNFSIKAKGTISQCFIARGITDFKGAAGFVRDLPYGRNKDKNDLTTVFSDGCGTCSTKHALLKQLAIEHNVEGIELILCIFKMNRSNSPVISKILDEHQLEYMPEAHNFLHINGGMLDVTKKKWDTAGIAENIITETVIQPEQITAHKVAWHQQFLRQWLEEHGEVPYSLEEFWEIRESCIRALY